MDHCDVGAVRVGSRPSADFSSKCFHCCMVTTNLSRNLTIHIHYFSVHSLSVGRTKCNFSGCSTSTVGSELNIGKRCRLPDDSIRYGKVTALSRKLSAAELAYGTFAVDKSTRPSHGRPHGKVSVADLQHNAAMQHAGLYSVTYYSLEDCYELRKKWTYQGRSN